MKKAFEGSGQRNRPKFEPLRSHRRIAQISTLSFVTATLWMMPAYADDVPIPSVQGAAASPPAVPIAIPVRDKKIEPSLQCHGDLMQQSTLNLPLGQSTTFGIPDIIKTRTVGNPGIVQSIQIGPKELYLVGTKIGSTNMMIQGRGGVCAVVSVTVSADPTGLQQALVMLMPDEKGVHVDAVADALVLSGQVSDAVQAQRIVELALRFVTPANTPVSNTPSTGQKTQEAASSTKEGSARVINMLTVAASQQVMLEVKVAEVSKTLIDELGLNVSFASSHFSTAVNTLLSIGNGNIDKVAVKASKLEQPVKILAEPNLMAISGQKASFMAGGKVFIPVPQSLGLGGGALISLQEETFGVKLSFMPTVLRDGLINLQVSPEVSELSDTGLAFSYGTEGQSQPVAVINTRSASTTIQLRDGQSFAIGGLMKDNLRGKVDAVPGLGEIPVLGALFRSTRYQSDKTELVFIVTPHLVKPLYANPPLPTDTFGKVNELNMYATGNLEGNPSQPKIMPPEGTKANLGNASPPMADSAVSVLTPQPQDTNSTKHDASPLVSPVTAAPAQSTLSEGSNVNPVAPSIADPAVPMSTPPLKGEDSTKHDASPPVPSSTAASDPNQALADAMQNLVKALVQSVQMAQKTEPAKGVK